MDPNTAKTRPSWQNWIFNGKQWIQINTESKKKLEKMGERVGTTSTLKRSSSSSEVKGEVDSGDERSYRNDETLEDQPGLTVEGQEDYTRRGSQNDPMSQKIRQYAASVQQMKQPNADKIRRGREKAKTKRRAARRRSLPRMGRRRRGRVVKAYDDMSLNTKYTMKSGLVMADID